MKLIKRIKAAIRTFKEPSITPINAYYEGVKVEAPSQKEINGRLDELEKNIKAGPGGNSGGMGGACLVKEKGVIKTIEFKTKKDALDIIQKVRDGELELVL